MTDIQIENVTYTYPDAGYPALSEVSLMTQAGQWILVQGPTGSGKSTLLKCLSGACPAFYGGQFAGRVRLGGVDVAGMSPRQRVETVGFVHQDPEAQSVYATVEHEVAFALENVGAPVEEMLWRVAEALDVVGLSDVIHQPLNTLSGGQRQRLALAAALVHQPKLLVLDEPTSQLDPVASEEWFDILRRLNEEFGLTIVMSEHRIDRAYQFVHEVVYVEAGRICERGTPAWMAEWLGAHRRQAAPTLSRITTGEAGPFLSVRDVHNSIQRGELVRIPSRGTTEGVRAVPEKGHIIALKDVVATYDASKPPALYDCDFEIYPHQVTAVIGANGAGKSTALRVLAGLQPIQAGRVSGSSVVKHKHGQRWTAAAQVAYVPQSPTEFFSQESVRAELTIPLRLRGLDEAACSDLIADVVEEFRVGGLLERHPRDLSGGERLMVAIAASMVGNPDVVLLDEPTRGLDVGVKQHFGNWLKSSARTCVIATHDMDFVAEFADRVLFFHQGRVVLSGHPSEVFRKALYFSPAISRALRGLDVDVHCLRDAIKVGLAR